ncbi:MAG: hypothetical protein P4L43_11715 [Syntrophobacteraceae bacterium]|nr:hypothetical protein [Syntrophobacteraceae bacterium]
MPDVAAPEIVLNQPCVRALVGEGEAASAAELVRVAGGGGHELSNLAGGQMFPVVIQPYSPEGQYAKGSFNIPDPYLAGHFLRELPR